MKAWDKAKRFSGAFIVAIPLIVPHIPDEPWWVVLFFLLHVSNGLYLLTGGYDES